MIKNIEKGPVKVTWIGDGTDGFYSGMFGNIEEAEGFGKKKKDYLIFKLAKSKNMKELTWELLPFGKYKLFKLLLGIYRTFLR